MRKQLTLAEAGQAGQTRAKPREVPRVQKDAKVIAFPGRAVPALLTAVPATKVGDLLPALMGYLVSSEVTGARVVRADGAELDLKLTATLRFRFEEEE